MSHIHRQPVAQPHHFQNQRLTINTVNTPGVITRTVAPGHQVVHQGAVLQRPSTTSSVQIHGGMRDSYTSTHSIVRAANPVHTQAAPTYRTVQPLNDTIVSAAPTQRSGALTRSTIVVDDEERYRRVAGDLHGYGRNKEGTWLGNSMHTYNKRLDKNFAASIVDSKTNADEYRYDPYCTLI